MTLLLLWNQGGPGGVTPNGVTAGEGATSTGGQQAATLTAPNGSPATRNPGFDPASFTLTAASGGGSSSTPSGSASSGSWGGGVGGQVGA
jgi:hypothetical protein